MDKTMQQRLPGKMRAGLWRCPPGIHYNTAQHSCSALGKLRHAGIAPGPSSTKTRAAFKAPWLLSSPQYTVTGTE